MIVINDILRELPMGFGMALMQNEKAFATFSAMDEARQKSVIEGTHKLRSKKEMRDYVDKLV